jgi:K+-sensing histidine kinase KdpD
VHPGWQDVVFIGIYIERQSGFFPASTAGRNAVGSARIDMTGSGTTDRPKLGSTDSKANIPKIARGGHIPLIRTLAHDLRNPISGILAASQCLLEDASVSLDAPQVTLLRAIESSSNLVLHLIEDMLEVARADSGHLRLRLRPTDVTSLVEKSAALQQKQADARNIRLTVVRDADIPRVEIDAPRFRWALNALLANTIRSSEQGGEIEIHVATRRKNVVIAVRHAGAGNARNEDSRGGSGRARRQARALTVSTARLIVEEHGGKIRVDRRATPPAYTLSLPKPEARKSRGALVKTTSSER